MTEQSCEMTNKFKSWTSTDSNNKCIIIKKAITVFHVNYFIKQRRIKPSQPSKPVAFFRESKLHSKSFEAMNQIELCCE